MKYATSISFTLLLATACGKNGSDASPGHTGAPAPAPVATQPTATAPAPTPPAQPTPDPASTPAAEAVEPCLFSAAEVSGALGEHYAEGKPLAPIAGVPTRSCAYDGKRSQLRVNVTAHSPAMAAEIRTQLGAGLAGARTPIAGDPDGAVFQMQTDVRTCALHYVRGRVQVEVRLMTCAEAEATARDKLLKLPRR